MTIEPRPDWPQAALTAYFERVITDRNAYFERVIKESDRRYEERFTAQKEATANALAAQALATANSLAAQALATAKAEDESQRWRESANEWRGAMTDREKQFATQVEVNDLKKSRDITAGQSTGRSDVWGWVVGALGIAMGIVGMVLAFGAGG